MVRRVVGVVERDAVRLHRVLPVLEPAEEGLAIAQTDPVRVHAERAGRVVQQFAEVRHRRRVVLNVLWADFRFRRTRLERALDRRQFGGHGNRTFHRDALGQFAHVERHIHIRGSSRGDLNAVAAAKGKTGGGGFDEVGALRQVLDRILAFRIRRRQLRRAAGFVTDGDHRIGNTLPRNVGNHARNRSRLLRERAENAKQKNGARPAYVSHAAYLQTSLVSVGLIRLAV